MQGLPDDILLKEEQLIALQLDIPFALKFTNALKKAHIEIAPCTTLERAVEEVCQLRSKM